VSRTTGRGAARGGPRPAGASGAVPGGAVYRTFPM